MDNNTSKNNSTSGKMTLSRRFWELYESNAVDSSHYDFLLIFALLLAEFVLGYLIIANVAYTEIDWEAYMEEVSAVVVDGQLDYREIRGSTGPLVYPAGFVYLFAFLRQITQQGQNIRLAQFIFLGFYVATQATVLLIYQMVMQAERQRFFDDIDNTTNTNWMTTTTTAEDEDNKSSTGLRKATTARSSPSIASQRLSLAHRIWCWRILLCVVCASKRLHSIFMLRLFNDGPTMLFLYMSMLLFMKQCWQWGCFIFSLAVSVKMNVLLYAPGLLLLLLQQSPNLWTVIVHRLFLGCALPQLVLGAPFLATYPISYLRKAFELDRVFFHKWTVNLKFLPNDIFVSKPWSLFLLCLHLSGLVVMAWKWLDRTAAQTRVQYRPGGRSEEGGLLKCLFLVPTTTTTSQGQLAPDYIAYTLMVSNFVGIAFARTLHYQFYSWYFHSIPLLLWFSANSLSGPSSSNRSRAQFPWLHLLVTLSVLVALEGAFLTFPATPISSAILQVAHAVILGRIFLSLPPPPLRMPGKSLAPAHSGETKKTL